MTAIDITRPGKTFDLIINYLTKLNEFNAVDITLIKGITSKLITCYPFSLTISSCVVFIGLDVSGFYIIPNHPTNQNVPYQNIV